MKYPDLAHVPGWDVGIPAVYDRYVAEAPPGSLLVEVGVYHGKSLAYLALEAKAADKGLRVVGVDWFRGTGLCGYGPSAKTADATLKTLEQFNLIDDVILVAANSVQAAKLFADRSCWLVFLDDDHSEPGIRGSISAWLPKVSGVLAGHDYGYPEWPAVEKVVTEVFGQGRRSIVSPQCWEVRIGV
jgi:hypothetical protein